MCRVVQRAKEFINSKLDTNLDDDEQIIAYQAWLEIRNNKGE